MAGLARQQHPGVHLSPSLALGLQTSTAVLGFLCGCWNVSPGPHACTASTPPTEPSPYALHLYSPYKMAKLLPSPPDGCPSLPFPSSSAQREAGHMPRTPNVHSDTLGGPPLENTSFLVTRIKCADKHHHLHALDKALPGQNENKPTSAPDRH